jgi:hypothetical protein
MRPSRTRTPVEGYGLRPAARRLARPLLVFLILINAAFPAHAEKDDSATSDDTWRTSISVALKAQQQRAEGEISSSLATDSDGIANPTPIPLDASNHDDYFVAIVPIELQLQTPTIRVGQLDVAARAFLLASYQFVPITDRDFLVDGKFVPLPPNPTAASQGLGGELRIDLQHQWSVSAGISIPVEIADFPIEIRPSLDYMGQWIRADAKTIGVQIGTDTLFVLQSEDSEAVHYLGPRLALETDAGRAGDTRWVFFAEGAAYFSRVAGRQRLSGDTTSGTEWARFSYEPDALLFQIGVGFRVYWEP